MSSITVSAGTFPDMTITVDWDIKHQLKLNKVFWRYDVIWGVVICGEGAGVNGPRAKRPIFSSVT